MTYKLFSFLPPLLLLFVSFGGNAQTEKVTEAGLNTSTEVVVQSASEPAIADTEFGDPITNEVFQNYLHLRTALVDSDAAEASKIASKMASTLAEERPELRAITQRIADSDDLAEQRIAFAELTAAAESLFTKKITDGSFYKLHCPMAMDGAGADWFSEVDEVRNPFYGNKMLKCGSVTGEIYSIIGFVLRRRGQLLTFTPIAIGGDPIILPPFWSARGRTSRIRKPSSWRKRSLRPRKKSPSCGR